MFTIARYKELSIKRIWSFVKEIPKLFKYFQEISDDELLYSLYINCFIHFENERVKEADIRSKKR